MITWQNDKELFALMKESLFTAVIGDILDKMGYLKQFLPPQITALQKGSVVVGRAMTVLESDLLESGGMSHNPLLNQPFGLMLDALDDLKEDEVYVCSGSSPTYALVGELMATRAQILGAAGAVVNGYIRDTSGIVALNFPVFSYGSYAQDQAPRGKVIDYRVPIEMNGVTILPGDLVFGDEDGVLIIPKAIEVEVIQKAYEKATGEKIVAKAIASGLSAKESFAKYGIM